MSKIIVIEGTDEIIIGSASAADSIISEWFVETGRSLVDFDIYLLDGDEGGLIQTRVKLASDSDAEHVDVSEVVSQELFEQLDALGMIID